MKSILENCYLHLFKAALKAGHKFYTFFPGGYSPKEDLVLLLEPARFKYPPFWVTVSKLLEAMRSVDPGDLQCEVLLEIYFFLKNISLFVASHVVLKSLPSNFIDTKIKFAFLLLGIPKSLLVTCITTCFPAPGLQ